MKIAHCGYARRVGTWRNDHDVGLGPESQKPTRLFHQLLGNVEPAGEGHSPVDMQEITCIM